MEKDNIEVLDDIDILDFDEPNVDKVVQEGQTAESISTPVDNLEESVNNINVDNNTEKEFISHEDNHDEENPITEMINNKKAIRIIIFILVILFIAVIAMPKAVELIKGLINK